MPASQCLDQEMQDKAGACKGGMLETVGRLGLAADDVPGAAALPGVARAAPAHQADVMSRNGRSSALHSEVPRLPGGGCQVRGLLEGMR